MKKKFLFLILGVIVVVGLFSYYYFGFNKESAFEVDSALLKITIKTTGSFDSQVRITNTGNKGKSFEVQLIDLEGLASFDVESFELEAGEAKNIKVIFSNENNLVEGIYAGGLKISSDSKVKLIPVILGVESEDVLFDTGNIALFPSGRISSGDKINAEVKIFDLSQIGAASIEINFFVKNFYGETILSETESIGIKEQVLITKSISLPENIETGDYVFGVILKYKNSIATGSAFFRVEEKSLIGGFFEGFGINVIYFVIFLIFVLLVLLIFVFYSIFLRDKLLDELKFQYRAELGRQKDYLKQKEKENLKPLKTRAERVLGRRLFGKVKKERRKAIKVIYKERVKKLKQLKKKRKKSEVQKQIAKWKKQGYNIGVLEKKIKVPTAKDVKNQIQAWKKGGYDAQVLERS